MSGLNITGIKNWKDWLHPVATVLGAWGGFPRPPKIFLELTKYELFRWFLIFVLAYQGGADEDLKQALIITTIFYLITKLLDLRDVVNDVSGAEDQKKSNLLAQKDAREQSAAIQAAQTAARQAASAAAIEATEAAGADAAAAQAAGADAAAKTEAFFGGYYV